MKTSEKGVALICSYEGLRLQAYLCPAGVPTIGYGHTKDVSIKHSITKDQAEKYLAEDLEDAEKTVNAQNLQLTQNQFDALVSFTFNVSAGKFKTSTLLKKIKADANDPLIADEFAKWKYGGGVVLPGLVRRRSDEAKLYFEK